MAIDKDHRTSRTTIDHLLDQASGAGQVSARAMFGEYGLYCNGRMVGVVCRDALFIKPTRPGEELEPDLERRPPYEGAKPSMLVPPDLIEDRDRLAALIKATASAVPPPKPRTRRR